jgi:hypothetical protein
MTPLIGTLVSSRICTLHELQTVYSLEDAYLMHDVIIVDAANELNASKK